MSRFISLLTILTLALSASAKDPATTQAANPIPEPPKTALYDKVAPSLVAIQYTYDGEAGRRDYVGAGVVISEDGMVIAPISLIPGGLPDAQIKNFKIIIPGDTEQEIAATFLGRDERSELIFVKASESRKWTAIHFVDKPLAVADDVCSVGLLPKEAGYKPFYSKAAVAAILRGPVPTVLVDGSGLTSPGSPVFNGGGDAVGLVETARGQSILLTGEQAFAGVMTPSRFFVPTRDFLSSLSDPPVAGSPMHIPWTGAIMTGVKKQVADIFDLKGQNVAFVADVIKDTPADKAGIKVSDMILKLDGQPLERGDEPDETASILWRKIGRMKVGDKVTLTILREKGKPTIDIPVTLEAEPRPAREANRWYAEDLGFAARESVFMDLYNKHLAADTKGVVVGFVRQGASASSAKLLLGDLITRINDSAVTDLDQFKTLYTDFRKKSPKESIVLEVTRETGTEVIRIEPPQGNSAAPSGGNKAPVQSQRSGAR